MKYVIWIVIFQSSKYAAQLLHRDAKSWKLDQLTKSQYGDIFFNISHAQPASMIPCKVFNVAATLLCGKDLPVGHGGKVCCDDELEENALHLYQHILYATCKIPTPLSLGSAFCIYNETRSKKVITLLNHMNESVSYDAFQRYLTFMCEQMIEEERQEGIFPPPVIAGCSFIHFAIDNADWHAKTPDGSTFHAMTTNVYGYEKSALNLSDVKDGTHAMTESVDQSLRTGHFGDIPRLSTSKKFR